jgi:indole-3-glycerol phosphate synthase/phosphoribosylanthranilate isomerase
MLSVLDEASYRDCVAAAAESGIATLTEVHSDDELEVALRTGAPVIGINNRDLTTLRVDLDVTRQLARLVPADRVVICESGIRSHAEVRRLAPLVDGFLVGTSLMRATVLPEAVRALVFGMTKVCGLTRPEDARAAFEAGATHGGLIFAPGSPRRVTVDQAAVVRQAAPLRWVGVFVNERAEVVADYARRLGLAAVQLHGDESRTDIAALRPALPRGCDVWKAVPVIDRIPMVADTGADRVVLDAASPAQRGGTGARWDWSLLADHPDLDRLVLAGGLTPELATAAEATGVGGLDVNSGVEERPGIKCPVRLAAFFQARRGLGRERSAS